MGAAASNLTSDGGTRLLKCIEEGIFSCVHCELKLIAGSECTLQGQGVCGLASAVAHELVSQLGLHSCSYDCVFLFFTRTSCHGMLPTALSMDFIGHTGNVQAVRDLIDAHPELLQYATYHSHLTCCHVAASTGAAAILQLLISRANHPLYSHSLPRQAVHRHRQSSAQLQLASQPGSRTWQDRSLAYKLVNARTNKCATPLMLAAEKGCCHSVRLLLQQVLLQDKRGPAQHVCCCGSFGKPELVGTHPRPQVATSPALLLGAL